MTKRLFGPDNLPGTYPGESLPVEEMSIEEERELARQEMRDFERKSGTKLASRARPKCLNRSPHTGRACVKSLGHGDDHAAGFPEDLSETWRRSQAKVRHLPANNILGGPLCGQDRRGDLGPESGTPCVKCNQKQAHDALAKTLTVPGPLVDIVRREADGGFKLFINGKPIIEGMEQGPAPTHGSLNVVRAKFKPK